MRPTPKPTRLLVVGASLMLCAAVGWASLAWTSGPAQAGEADVVGARAVSEGRGRWRFDVTVRHADEGWEHYSDKWDVLGPEGEVLGTRVLVHPHVDEQPFTRSLRALVLPEEIREVTIRAHDSVHKYGGAEITLQLPPN